MTTDPHDVLVEQAAALEQIIALLRRGDDRDFGLAMVLSSISELINVATDQIGRESMPIQKVA